MVYWTGMLALWHKGNVVHILVVRCCMIAATAFNACPEAAIFSGLHTKLDKKNNNSKFKAFQLIVGQVSNVSARRLVKLD